MWSSTAVIQLYFPSPHCLDSGTDRRRLPVFANFKEVVLMEYQSTLEERPVATGIQTTEFASGT